MKVLVVTADRALRASLSYLLKLEPDLEVWDCSPREADGLLDQVNPDVVLANGAWTAAGKRVIGLSGLAPYDSLLKEMREAV